MAHAGGRPPKYKTVKQLKYWVDLFFKDCDKNNKRPKLTGLYRFLNVWPGYFSSSTNENGEEFNKVIKEATVKIASFYENAIDDKGTSPALGIFMLKNCGYTDRVEVNANINETSNLADLARAVRDKRAKQGQAIK